MLPFSYPSLPSFSSLTTDSPTTPEDIPSNLPSPNAFPSLLQGGRTQLSPFDNDDDDKAKFLSFSPPRETEGGILLEREGEGGGTGGRDTIGTGRVMEEAGLSSFSFLSSPPSSVTELRASEIDSGWRVGRRHGWLGLFQIPPLKENSLSPSTVAKKGERERGLRKFLLFSPKFLQLCLEQNKKKGLKFLLVDVSASV